MQNLLSNALDSRLTVAKISPLRCKAGVAQLVERNLAKVEVDGSNPFARSIQHRFMVEA